MGAIFISHSSKDNAAAADLRDRLEEDGHRSLFLDFDPADGIPAGRSWEQELYSNLRGCRAVIVLCSSDSMASDWCFAEITHAKSLGKHIFPLIITDCTLRPILSDVQVIDLRANEEQGYERLKRGLLAAGLDPRDMFTWDGSRPLYPGLLAFQEADASIYFGRDAEIQEGLDILNRLHHFGGAGIMLILGASGSGKSSLARAGLIPRLKRDPERWVVVDTFRPLSRPMKELARVFRDAFARYESPRSPLRGRKGLVEIADSLRIVAGRREARVLLVVDQFEELLGYATEDQRHRFLAFLRAAMDAPDSSLMVIGTLRSDFLGQFQNEPALRDMTFESLPIGPLSKDGFSQVIEGPAALGGVELKDGLVHAIVGDTGANDALPLLAFTLRELYERYGDDNVLELEEYNALGRLEGSVARSAEAVMAAKRLSEAELDDLRTAFVSMVRINEQGQYSRRVARWGDMPQRVHGMLERFVEARLLVSQTDGEDRIVEVAHEALFRTWRQLQQWLNEDRDSIRLRDGIHEAAKEWDTGGREAQLLVHKAGRLETAEILMRTPRFEFETLARNYVQACIDEREALRAVEQRRERAKRQRLQWTIAGLAAGLLIVAAFGVVAFQQRNAAIEAQATADVARRAAEKERTAALRNESNLLIAQSRDAVRRNDYVGAANLALSALPTTMAKPDRPYIPEAEVALYTAAINLTGVSEVKVLKGHSSRVTFAAFSPDGTRIVTASHDGTASLWDVASGQQLAVFGGNNGRIAHAAFSPDSRRVATAAVGQTVRVWDASTGGMLAELKSALKPGFADAFYFVSFSPNGQRLAAVGSGSGTNLWDLSNNQRIATIKREATFPVHVLFSPDGSRLLTTDRYERGAALWDAQTGGLVTELRGHTAGLYSAQFSSNGTRIVTASADGTARVWNSQSGDSIHTLSGHTDKVFSAEFSQDMQKIVTASKDGTARLWDAATGREIATMVGHKGEVRHASFSPDGERIVSASRDDTAIIWNTAGNLTKILSGHSADVTHAVFSQDGRWVLTTGDTTARLWRPESSGIIVPLHGHSEPVHVAAFSSDGKIVATGAGKITSVGETSADSTVRLWSVEDGKQLGVLRGHSNMIKTLGFSHDGTLLLSSGFDHTARLWDVQQQRLIKSFKGLRARLSRDGNMIATADGKDVELLDTKSGRILANLAGHSKVVSDLVFSPDGNRLITTSWDKTARLWDIPSGKLRATLVGHSDWINSATFSPDSKFVVTVAGNKTYYKESDDNTARVWNTNIGAPIAVFKDHHEQVNVAAFSPDGRLVATASGANNDRTKVDRSDSRDDRVLLWEPSTGALRMELKGHTRPVVHIEFSGDGKRLVTASQDFTARVWDVETGVTVAVLQHGSFVNAATFVGDGTRLATASGDEYLEQKDYTARLWRLFPDTQSLINYVRGNLEHSERAQ